MKLTLNRRLSVVAIAATGLLCLNGCGEGSSTVDPQPSTMPSDTPTAATSSPPTTAPTSAPTTSAPPALTPPAVTYAVAGKVHLPDGTTRPLTKDAQSFTLLPDGRLAVVTNDNGSLTVTVTGGGKQSAAYPLVGSLVVGEAGKGVAWVTPDGTPTVLQNGRTQPVKLAKVAGEPLSAAALSGTDCTTDAETTVDGGCSVVVNMAGAKPGVQISSSHGFSDDYISGVLKVTDVSADGARVAGVVSVSDDGSCSAVFDVAKSKELWKTCEFSGLQFAPDGAHLSAEPGYVDGLGPRRIFVLDASGKLVGKSAVYDVVGQTTWESPTALLLDTFGAGAWTVNRLGPDGIAQPTTPAVPGENVTPAYLLAVS